MLSRCLFLWLWQRIPRQRFSTACPIPTNFSGILRRWLWEDQPVCRKVMVGKLRQAWTSSMAARYLPPVGISWQQRCGGSWLTEKGRNAFRIRRGVLRPDQIGLKKACTAAEGRPAAKASSSV